MKIKTLAYLYQSFFDVFRPFPYSCFQFYIFTRVVVQFRFCRIVSLQELSFVTVSAVEGCVSHTPRTGRFLPVFLCSLASCKTPPRACRNRCHCSYDGPCCWSLLELYLVALQTFRRRRLFPSTCRRSKVVDCF